MRADGAICVFKRHVRVVEVRPRGVGVEGVLERGARQDGRLRDSGSTVVVRGPDLMDPVVVDRRTRSHRVRHAHGDRVAERHPPHNAGDDPVECDRRPVRRPVRAPHRLRDHHRPRMRGALHILRRERRHSRRDRTRRRPRVKSELQGFKAHAHTLTPPQQQQRRESILSQEEKDEDEF